MMCESVVWHVCGEAAKCCAARRADVALHKMLAIKQRCHACGQAAMTAYGTICQVDVFGEDF
jgi:hypothetical protein